jgi:hypothetical protein
MKTSIDFQMVCNNCGCLGIRIEDPEQASREAIVHCGDCGVSRGTVGALRDLAVRPEALAVQPIVNQAAKTKARTKLVALHFELQSLRRQLQTAESRRKS